MYCLSYSILEYNTYRISVPFRLRLVISSKGLVIYNKWKVKSRSFSCKYDLYICILDWIHWIKLYFSLFNTKGIWGSLFLTWWNNKYRIYPPTWESYDHFYRYRKSIWQNPTSTSYKLLCKLEIVEPPPPDKLHLWSTNDNIIFIVERLKANKIKIQYNIPLFIFVFL